MNEHIVDIITAHMCSFKKGFKLFNENAEGMEVKELTQIHDMDIYTPMNPEILMPEETERPCRLCFSLLRSTVEA